MAKYRFTKSQFDEIIRLLKKRPTEGPDEQKKTRAKIRRLGFRISDYFNGFTDLDFKKLLTIGDIQIIDNQASSLTQTSTKAFINQIVSKPEISSSKQALPPVIDKTTKYLILGTMPGEKSLINKEYYNNPRNQFWKIISLIFNEGKPFSNYSDKIKILRKNKIGLWDVLDTCERDGSLDSKIKNQTLNNFDELFKNFQNIIFNGQDSYSYFNTIILDKGDKKYIQLTSTSSANTHKTLNEKAVEWETALK